MALVVLVAGKKLAPLGAALGLAGGVFLGDRIPALLTLEPRDSVAAYLWQALVLSPGDPPWNHLRWAALAALLAGLLARLPWVPPAVGWTLRAAVVVTAGSWILPADVRAATWWLPPVFTAVVLAEWALLEYLASRPPDGDVPLALALSALAGATVLIFAATGRLNGVMVVLAAALGGIAVVAWWRRADSGGAVGAAVMLLAGVLLMGNETKAEPTEDSPGVAWPAFALAAGAPLILAVALLPPFRSWQGWRLRFLRFGLLLAPLTVAIALALQAGPLEFE
jgi:hypothetical protein